MHCGTPGRAPAPTRRSSSGRYARCGPGSAQPQGSFSGTAETQAKVLKLLYQVILQCDSQEDGTYKSGRATLGAGCTIGVGAFVHYDVTMNDGAELAADSFLMKGHEVPSHARWGGNPAREL